MKPFTRHAEKRRQQRGLPRSLLALLTTYGRKAYDHRGAVIRTFDRKARAAIVRALGPQVLKFLQEHRDAYLVQSASSGTVITCGHRYRGVRHG